MYAYNGINTHLVPYIYSSVQFSKRDASVYRHIYMCWDSWIIVNFFGAAISYSFLIDI